MRVWRGATGWAVVLVSSVLAGIILILANLWLPAIFTAGMASLVAVIAGVWTSRGTKVLTERDQQRRGLPALILLSGRGGLPKVRDLDDPVALGVHPAADSRMPEFIPRDITSRLCDLIRQDRFVLVVGESTAGKSRAAYESMRALCPDHRLIQPAGKEALAAAVQAVQENVRSILWLDDLERFLGADGLTGAAVSNILAISGSNRLILATMRAEEYAKYSGRTGHDDSPSRVAIRRGWEVLRLATRLTLPRTWSVDELERAAQNRDDPSIREALEHSDRFGIAEYLAAGPQLLADLQDAWAPGTHPRAAALVVAAADARRVGMHRPLSLATLTDLHWHYLERRGGHLLRPESLEDAVTWATTPLHATSSLLLPQDGNTYLAFDYLIDAVDKAPVATEVLKVLLVGATPEESMEIGEMAWSWHLLDTAEAAFRLAQDSDHFPGMQRRCHLIRERDGSAAGLRFAENELQRYVKQGLHSAAAIEIADVVAWETGHDGDSRAALEQLELLLPAAVDVFGEEHRTTLGIRSGIAYWTGVSGDHAASARLSSQVASDCARILGGTNQFTIFAREVAADQIGRSGDWELAISLLHKLIQDMEDEQSHPHDLFNARTQLAYRTVESEDYASAVSLWERLSKESVATSGHLHLITLSLRAEYATCVGAAGEPKKAVELLRKVVADAGKLPGPPSTNILGLSRRLATWIGKAGNASEAVCEFDNLLTVATRQRGARDGWTLGLRRRRAHWVGEAGDPRGAVRDLEKLLVDSASNDEIAKATYESLIFWRERAQSS